MKKYFLLLIYVFTSFAFSQESNDKKVFMDSLSNETSENNYHHYCIIKDYYLDLNEYKVIGYYKSGKLRVEGIFKDKGLKKPIGEEIFYYENGNKMELGHFNDDSKLDGEFMSWYENGNKKSQLTYSNSDPIGLETTWYENGNKKQITEFTGLKLETGHYFRYLQVWNENNKQIVIDGNGLYDITDKTGSLLVRIKDGFYDGVLKEKKFKTNTSRTETYENGKFISGVFTDENKNTHEYTVLATQPAPKKGLDDFRNYLGKNIKIPRKAKIFTGKILIEFIIDKDGKITEPKIVNGLDPELDKEALKVLMRYEDWIPGQQRGQNIRARYLIPLMFHLPN